MCAVRTCKAPRALTIDLSRRPSAFHAWVDVCRDCAVRIVELRHAVIYRKGAVRIEQAR